jgi:6-phosphogluconolactonase (cycloisomerase 2 family)
MSCENRKWCGMAFAMSNRAFNSVSVFARDLCGALRFLDESVTAGSGTAEAIVDPLGSQGALATGGRGRFLFAVNAGDNTVSSFRLERGCVTLASVMPSGGVRPVSIAVHGNLAYVANAGDATNRATVSGFFVGNDGVLSPIPNSTALLSMSDPQPACAVFSPNGNWLIVSERRTNFLVAFPVLPGGLLGNPTVTVSNGAGPFGMAFARHDVLLVTEAGPNALSSYRLAEGGALEVISASVPTNQGATCWVSVTPDGRRAYTSNAATGTISLFRVARDGALTLMESVPSTPLMNGAPIDSAIDPCGEFLYVLNGALGSISVFLIECEGRLALVQIYENTSLPTVGAQGIAVV